MAWLECEITALDTLFFRKAEPFTAGESVFLESLFPPTPRTVQGLVRTALLEAHCVDLRLFAAGGCDRCPEQATCAVRNVVGSPDGVGTLRLRGPHLLQTRAGRSVRLYPAPSDLRRDEAGARFRLEPGEVVLSDAGRVRLPGRMDGGSDLGQPAEWLTENGLRTYLADRLPAASQFVEQEDLVDGEPRVGLARDAGKRTAREGMLYSVKPLRPRSGVRLGLWIDGASDTLPAASGTRRFGGEGRLVQLVERPEPPTGSAVPRDRASPWSTNDPLDGDHRLRAERLRRITRSSRLRLVLLQPADCGDNWLPAEFDRADDGGVTCWRGKLHGVGLKVIVSCGEQPIPIGGWDLARNRPIAPRRCVPAGTVYYCELDPPPGDIDEMLGALHAGGLGQDTALGFGQVAVGAW